MPSRAVWTNNQSLNALEHNQLLEISHHMNSAAACHVDHFQSSDDHWSLMIIMLVIFAIKILVMNNFQDHNVDDIGDVQMKMLIISGD